MRTTVDLDEEALRRAQDYAPELNKTKLINEALRAFARQESRRRIIEGALHNPNFVPPPRRRVS